MKDDKMLIKGGITLESLTHSPGKSSSIVNNTDELYHAYVSITLPTGKDKPDVGSVFTVYLLSDGQKTVCLGNITVTTDDRNFVFDTSAMCPGGLPEIWGISVEKSHGHKNDLEASQ